jgi:hypothetical protein
MSEPKWTPGPWSATKHGDIWQIDAATDAVVTTAFCYAPQTEANARLVALSPRLYDALNRLIQALDAGDRPPHDSCLRVEARAALAEAIRE